MARVSTVGHGAVVVLLGPPGVGKGTQGVMLAEGIGLRHLSTGDLLRKHRKDGTQLGRKAQSYMDRGALVPDDLILDMVGDVLASLGKNEGLVFDGFPRTEAQADSLDRVLAAAGRGVDRVVVLQADDEVIVQRLGGRRSCPACNAVYNVHTNPPRQEGRCDRCGEKLVHRDDDKPETIRKRLQVYRDETEPLIRYYQNAAPSAVVFVDGSRSPDAVQDEIRAAVNSGGATSAGQPR
jgi:adenylate kinase